VVIAFHLVGGRTGAPHKILWEDVFFYFFWHMDIVTSLWLAAQA
jgi:hypothetical protein